MCVDLRCLNLTGRSRGRHLPVKLRKTARVPGQTAAGQGLARATRRSSPDRESESRTGAAADDGVDSIVIWVTLIVAVGHLVVTRGGEGVVAFRL